MKRSPNTNPNRSLRVEGSVYSKKSMTEPTLLEMPGFLLGALNLGFFAVVTFAATNFLTLGLHSQSSALFAIIAVLWGYTMAFVAIKGIHYVAKVAHFLNWVPLCMVLVVLYASWTGISHYHPPTNHPWAAFAGILEIVVGYFAAAGAAGADF